MVEQLVGLGDVHQGNVDRLCFQLYCIVACICLFTHLDAGSFQVLVQVSLLYHSLAELPGFCDSSDLLRSKNQVGVSKCVHRY